MKELSLDESQVSPTHSFEVADAIRFGSVEKALIYKELKNMLAYKMRHDSAPWVYYSGEALSKKFPYMNDRSIRRWMEELEEEGHINSRIKNKVKYDQTKSYSIPGYTIGQKEKSVGQNDQTNNDIDPSIGQNGRPIPSLSTSLSSTQSSKGVSIETKEEIQPDYFKKNIPDFLKVKVRE